MHIHSRDKSFSLNFCFIIGYLPYYNWNWLQWNRQWESHCYTTIISILYLHHIVYQRQILIIWISLYNYPPPVSILLEESLYEFGYFEGNIWLSFGHRHDLHWKSFITENLNVSNYFITCVFKRTILFFMKQIKFWILKGQFIFMRANQPNAVEPICLMKFVFHPNSEIIIIITKKYQLI